MENAYKAILDAIGDDPNREGLSKTPARAAESLRYLTQGYGQDVDEIINGSLFASDNT